MGDAESRKSLERTLGKLLGFEEGEAEELLEHLFTIDSDDDLSEYLVQLLGGQSPEMDDFVKNMSRYRMGESIATVGEDQGENDEDDSSKKPAALSSSQDSAALDSFRTMAIGNSAKTSKKNASRKNARQKQAGKSRVPPPKNVKAQKSPPPQNDSSAQRSSKSFSRNTAQEEASKPQQDKTEVVEKSRPERGKATVVCGCFGTRDKALTNCLYCGRIICEKEGYGFCPFCGFKVEEAV